MIKQLISQPKTTSPFKPTGNGRTEQICTPLPDRKLQDQEAIVMSAKSLTSSQKPQIHFLAHKAGMDNVDMDAIRKKIYELEKDTEFYKKQQFKTERAKTKGRNMLAKI